MTHITESSYETVSKFEWEAKLLLNREWPSQAIPDSHLLGSLTPGN